MIESIIGINYCWSAKNKIYDQLTKKSDTFKLWNGLFRLVCFPFWRKVNSSIFKTFSDALTFCNDDSSDFFAPANQEAHDTIYTEAMIQFGTQPYWIGIADYDDEGRFVFIDGDFQDRDIRFTHWAPNQPNNYGIG